MHLLAVTLATTLLLCAGPPTTLAQSTSQRIITASAVRVRSAPNTAASVVGSLPLGEVVAERGRSTSRQRVGETEDYWYQIAAPGGVSGWVFGGLTAPYDASRRDEILVSIARERLEHVGLGFEDRTDFIRFVDTSVPTVERATRAELELARLLTMRDLLEGVDWDQQRREPYESWIDRNQDEIVYSEPSASWHVRSDRIWDLHDRYKDLPIADRIAWAAATNPLPGECEGDVTCYMFMISVTDARYLLSHPKGEYSADALTKIEDHLTNFMASFEQHPGNYDMPADDEQRAEMRRHLETIRNAVRGTSHELTKPALDRLDAFQARVL